MNRLKNTLVEEGELNLVKSYLMGSLLSSVDGAFNLAGALENTYLYGLDVSYLNQLIQTIEQITPKDLQILANKYFDESQMTQIVVGR